MSLKGFILRRTIYIVPIMIGVTLINFTLIDASPGDPIRIRVGLVSCTTPDCYNDAYNREALAMGLIDSDGYTVPWVTRYFDFLNRILRFDLGDSWSMMQAGKGVPVSRIIADHAVYTI